MGVYWHEKSMAREGQSTAEMNISFVSMSLWSEKFNAFPHSLYFCFAKITTNFEKGKVNKGYEFRALFCAISASYLC